MYIGVIPAAQVAVSIINANTDILGDYELELVHDVDSQVCVYFNQIMLKSMIRIRQSRLTCIVQ